MIVFGVDIFRNDMIRKIAELRLRLSDSFAPFKCYPLPSMLMTKTPIGEEEGNEDYSELAAYRDALLQERTNQPEVLPLKNESRILGQWSIPGSGSRKSQASSPWAKQHII